MPWLISGVRFELELPPSGPDIPTTPYPKGQSSAQAQQTIRPYCIYSPDPHSPGPSNSTLTALTLLLY